MEVREVSYKFLLYQNSRNLHVCIFYARVTYLLLLYGLFSQISGER